MLPRLTPPVAPVRERRSVTAQAGGASPRNHPDDATTSSHCRCKPTANGFQEQVLQSMNAPHPSKSALRRKLRKTRASMSPADRDSASLQICATLVRQSFFQRATSVAIYLPTEDEVSCWPLIERGWRMKKRIFAPVVKKNSILQFCELRQNAELRRNRYRILEPVGGQCIDSRNLDIVITPLLAFDDCGNRPGHGGWLLRPRFFVYEDTTVLHKTETGWCCL